MDRATGLGRAIFAAVLLVIGGVLNIIPAHLGEFLGGSYQPLRGRRNRPRVGVRRLRKGAAVMNGDGDGPSVGTACYGRSEGRRGGPGDFSNRRAWCRRSM